MGTTILTAESYINNELQFYKKQGWVEQVPQMVRVCYDWYRGFVEDFHKYYIKTGTNTFTNLEKLPLYMGKKIGEDWANHLINEKVAIVTKNQTTLDLLLEKTKTKLKLNRGVEQSFALGYGVMVQGVKNLEVEDGEVVGNTDAYITNDFVPAIMCRPLTYVDREVEDIAFVFENTKFINVILHIRDTRKTIKVDETTEAVNDNYNNYDIINIKIRNQGDYGVEDKFTFHTKSPIKLFQIIQPNICNNSDLDSPLSVSVYANAIPTLKAVDNAYDSLNNEIQLGRKRIIADVDQYTEVDSKGNKVNTFDPNDALIYSIPAREGKIGQESKQLIEDISGNLRIDQITIALNQQLNILSSKVGFGENYYRYSDAQKGVTTATQVISENSTLYKTMKKHELLLETAIKDMVIALSYLNDTFTTNASLGIVNEDDVEVQFDDSIIEDTGAQKQSDRQDVTNGVMSKVEYRCKYYGEEEKTAIENLMKFNVDLITSKAEQLSVMLNDGYITPTAFVKLVFAPYAEFIPDYNEAELIAKVEDSVVNNKPIPSPFDDLDLTDGE